MKIWNFLFRIYVFFTDRKYLSYVLIGASLVLFFVSYRTHLNRNLKNDDFARFYTALEADDLPTLLKLSNNMELRSRIEPYLAQKFILRADSEGIRLAKARVEKVEKELPNYSTYAKTSLLAADENYEGALELSKALSVEEKSGSFLYYYNLLRMVVLSESLKDSKREREALEILEKALKETAAADFLASFRADNGFDIKDYITFRKTELK